MVEYAFGRVFFFFFFFSSRRRHTRFDCDWSSDVCSSDLIVSHGPETTRMTGVAFALLGTVGLLSLLGLRRSEEHTSELQSQSNLVCRLLLEKKKKKKTNNQKSNISQNKSFVDNTLNAKHY